MVCWKVPVKGKGWWAFRGWKKPARAGPVAGCGRVALGGRCRCPWLATLHQSYPRFAPYKNSKRNTRSVASPFGDRLLHLRVAHNKEDHTHSRKPTKRVRKNKYWTRRFHIIRCVALLLLLLFLLRVLTTAKLDTYSLSTGGP